MPTKGLKEIQIKMLTYAFYAVLFILCGVTVWNSIKITEIPMNFITLERYNISEKDTKETFKSIDRKLTAILIKMR